MRQNEGGFTLLETGLAIVVSMTIFVASVYAFRALKEQSGDATMRQKVQDLQVLIEELYTPTQAFPSDDALRAAWAMRRGDHNASPYGGPVIQGGDFKGMSISFLNHGDDVPYAEFSDFQGGVYFYPIGRQADGRPGSATLWDVGRGQSVSATFYAVAGNKVTRAGGLRHYFVLSGR